MGEEQLDKMAKVRAAKKPPAYKNIHEDVKDLPDDNNQETTEDSPKKDDADVVDADFEEVEPEKKDE